MIVLRSGFPFSLDDMSDLLLDTKNHYISRYSTHVNTIEQIYVYKNKMHLCKFGECESLHINKNDCSKIRFKPSIFSSSIFVLKLLNYVTYNTYDMIESTKKFIVRCSVLNKYSKMINHSY